MSHELDALIADARQRLRDATRELQETGDTSLLAKVRRNQRILRSLEAVRDGRTLPKAAPAPEQPTAAKPTSRPLPIAEETYPTWMWNGSTL